MRAEIQDDEVVESRYLAERARWLVRLRYMAVVCVGVAAWAGWATGFVREPLDLLGVGGALALYNAWMWRRLRMREGDARLARRRWFIFEQLLVDMGALALLLDCSGGVENPFGMLFALSVAIGAMLLTARQAAALGVVGTLFYVTIAVGQLTGVLAHHGLHGQYQAGGIVDPLYRSPRFVGGYVLAFAAMLAGVIYLVRSVTERYRHAEALRREQERIALVRERFSRVGEVSAGVAHAVRNPLHGLLNSVALLQPKVAGDSRAEETLSLMAEALGRIESVTARLLSLTHDAPLQIVSCDVDALVQGTLKLVTPSPASTAKVRAELGAPGEAHLDPHRFAEALTNVVDNAVQACRNGGTVTVRTSLQEASVAVDVIDSGKGISPEHLKNVFDPFFTTKAVGEGTGLGLALARRIVEEHGGRLSLGSEPGRGTTVRILVPRHAAVAPGEAR
jgi:signal transduction histidine kinase